MYYLWNSLHRLEGSTVGSLYTINGAITSSGDSSELELTLVASVSVATVQKCDTPDEEQACNTFVTKDCTAGILALWLYGERVGAKWRTIAAEV